MMMMFMDEGQFYLERMFAAKDLNFFIQKKDIALIDIFQPQSQRRFRRPLRLKPVFDNNKVAVRRQADLQRTIQRYRIVLDTILDQELERKGRDERWKLFRINTDRKIDAVLKARLQ